MILVQSASQTIVRKSGAGSDRAGDRFVIIYEMKTADSGFACGVAGMEMTMSEVCDALIARGISENVAIALLNEAVASFHHP